MACWWSQGTWITLLWLEWTAHRGQRLVEGTLHAKTPIPPRAVGGDWASGDLNDVDIRGGENAFECWLLNGAGHQSFCLLHPPCEARSCFFQLKKKSRRMQHPTSYFPPPPNVCGAQQLSLQILPLRIGMAVHNQEWSGEAKIVGWLQAAGGNELFS